VPHEALRHFTLSGRESEAAGSFSPISPDAALPEKLRAALESLLHAYGLADSRFELINKSENTTFRVDPAAGGRPVVLRLYRVGQRADAEIQSELDWMEALRTEADISTPRALATCDGRRISKIILPDGAAASCVAFEYLSGAEPPPEGLALWFERLGAISAQIHLHGRSWRRPQTFQRPLFDYVTLIGPRAVWGSWERAPGLDAHAVAVLRQASAEIAKRLAEYGQTPDRFGLIHGDLRLANLLVDGPRIHVIDFDDCGTGWLLYDLSTAISLIEHLPEAESFVQAWLRGYQRLMPLSEVHVAMVRHLIMMRRLQVLSWFGRNLGSALVLEYSPVVVPATVAAAASYLRLGTRRAAEFLPQS
jgi:Ser/Thr protein kinase RdoA (MazF antagonist)